MKSRVHQRGPATISANMTPLIDVVFLLIVFFMLVAQFTHQQTIELDLPEIPDAVTVELAGETNAIINVVPEAMIEQLGGSFRLGGRSFVDSPSGLAELSEALHEMFLRQPDLQVLIRASRGEMYERVEPVLDAVRQAGISRLNLMTVPPDDRTSS